MIVDISISFIPFLIIILFEVLMSWMDGKVLSNPGNQLQLLIYLVQKQIIFFTNHTMAVAAISGEYLKS